MTQDIKNAAEEVFARAMSTRMGKLCLNANQDGAGSMDWLVDTMDIIAQTPAKITVCMQNVDGYGTKGKGSVTLSLENGEWLISDLQDSLEG